MCGSSVKDVTCVREVVVVEGSGVIMSGSSVRDVTCVTCVRGAIEVEGAGVIITECGQSLLTSERNKIS